MPTQIQGNGGTVIDVDGTSFRSLRVTSRPIEYSAGDGHYSAGAVGGIMAAGLAANSEIFQFRWNQSLVSAVINRVKICAAVSTTGFAAGVPLQLALYKSTSWSVSGSGGVPLSFGSNCKMRTSMASTSVGDFRISGTGALGAGTKTLDANPLSQIVAPGVGSTLIPCIIPVGTVFLESNVARGAHPLFLANNEGFSIIAVAVPGTGTWTFSVEVQWAEVGSY